jgi:uncharacterized protein (DUF1697 family)
MHELPANLALLRGVNVGGKNCVPMTQLAQVFVDAGCTDVRTYIQSGNVIFKASQSKLKTLPGIITQRIEETSGARFQ